jgi:wax ester synthase-like acyl-CoA acyltransferase family protein
MSERLSSADAAWLHMDRPTNLMVINSVLLFDRPVNWERVRQVTQQRLVDCYPKFHQRIVESRLPFRPPKWEDDPDFALSLEASRRVTENAASESRVEGARARRERPGRAPAHTQLRSYPGRFPVGDPDGVMWQHAYLRSVISRASSPPGRAKRQGRQVDRRSEIQRLCVLVGMYLRRESVATVRHTLHPHMPASARPRKSPRSLVADRSRPWRA